ncbi:hypothetical protein [Candidatus Williamhamiltonella defendens]|uniref:hypothetical protein n=1 Tax=Candidatus Williamhamiltonella defendens TaxID=138072 RepID=UPI0015821745|nr:hypothetical protein [Candidatus Hamiltonella defensa]
MFPIQKLPGTSAAGHINQKPLFVRHESTNNVIDNIENKYYPSLEKDFILKDSIRSAFHRASVFFNKANRPDVITDSACRASDIRTMRTRLSAYIDNMPDDLEKELDEAKADGDLVTVQRIYAELVAKTYQDPLSLQEQTSRQTTSASPETIEIISETEDKYIEGAPTFCGEMSYLFYHFLCQEGVDPNEMRVICFTQEDPHIDPDSLNNHALIIYSSNKELLKKMENYCGVGEHHDHDGSYSHFIDICTERNQEKDVLLLIDPWNRDNKIIDPLIKDRVFEYIKNSNKDEQKIEKIFLKHLVDTILIESEVLPQDHNQYDFNDLWEASICIDKPIDSSSDESEGDYQS